MRNRLKSLGNKAVIYLILITVSAVMLIPFVWMLVSSFKMNKDVFTYPVVWWPE